MTGLIQVIERNALQSRAAGSMGADFCADVGVKAAEHFSVMLPPGPFLKFVPRRRDASRQDSAPSPECASSCFQTQLLNSIHPREGTKKWLFIRILVLYCSASHKRGFIM